MIHGEDGEPAGEPVRPLRDYLYLLLRSSDIRDSTNIEEAKELAEIDQSMMDVDAMLDDEQRVEIVRLRRLLFMEIGAWVDVENDATSDGYA